MHSSQSSKNKSIREGSRLSRRLSICVSYQKVVNVFRLNLVFGVYSAVELVEFCDATPWSLAFRGSCCRRPQRRCNSALETSRRLPLPTNCTHCNQYNTNWLAFLMELKRLSCKAEHVLKVLFTLMETSDQKDERSKPGTFLTKWCCSHHPVHQIYSVSRYWNGSPIAHNLLLFVLRLSSMQPSGVSPKKIYEPWIEVSEFPEGPATCHLCTGCLGFPLSSSCKLLLPVPHAAIHI